MATVIGQAALPAARATRGGLHRSVVERVAMDILGGLYPPGETLPSEVELGARLGVGRSSIREAMRVLADKGIVRVNTRTGARVNDRRLWRRLDPDVVRWTLAAGPDAEFLGHLIEARRIIEPEAAALAARRATGADLAAIDAALSAMQAALGVSPADCVEADLAFHRAVLAASGNPVLEEFEVVIEAALRAAFTLSHAQSQSYELALERHAGVRDAIRMKDPAGAHAAMVALLAVAARDLRLP